MHRVPWERHEGDDVEAVVAMMVNLEHPDSTRITPSRGDGGIDILDSLAGPDSGDVVYQVKRYAGPLKSKQKKEVEKSLARLLGEKHDARWAHLNVTQWRLVLPWDPTPEALTWLRELGTKYEVEAIWDGLTTIDRWCAQYPEVIDYYLEGGSQRIEAAYRQAMSFTSLAAPDTQGLDVRSLAERVQESVNGPLSQDPHYTYAFRFGTGRPPRVASNAGLAMSTTAVRNDGWFAIDVLARCAASSEARPITMSANFSATKGSPQADALQKFLEYGVTPPEPLRFVGELDAPGGLSATLNDATAQILPMPGSTSDETAQLRLEVVDPAGKVLAACNADRVHAGSGTKGGSFIIRESNRVFELAGNVNAGASNPDVDSTKVGEKVHARMRLKLTTESMIGAPVLTISGAISFLENLHEPNQLRLGVRHLPAERGVTQPLTGTEPSPTLAELADVVRALSTIQQHATGAVRVPDLDAHRGQIPTWKKIAQLLEGERVGGHYPEGTMLVVDSDDDYSDSDGDLSVRQQLDVLIGSDRHDLGEILLELDAPTLKYRAVLPDGNYRLGFETLNRTIYWTLHDSRTQVSDSDEPSLEDGSEGP